MGRRSGSVFGGLAMRGRVGGVVGEETLVAVVGLEFVQGELDAARADERQRGEVVARGGEAGAFEQEHGVAFGGR